MEYVKSEKGKEKLLFEGFVYVKQKNKLFHLSVRNADIQPQVKPSIW